jgi:hypothetical protein
MNKNRLHNMRSGIMKKNMKDHSAKQAAVFIETKNDAGSFQKRETTNRMRS